MTTWPAAPKPTPEGLHAALKRAERQATYDFQYARSAWGSQDPATKLRAESLAKIQARLAGGE